MGSPERVRSSARQETEEDIEVNIDSVKDDDDWVVDDKKRHRSSKCRKSGSGEDVDGSDVSSRKRSMSDRHESRKRVSSSSRADTDQDDYETRKESRSKQVKRKPDGNTLDVLSTWYEDGEAENMRESERKESSSKFSEHDTDVAENAQNRGLRDSARRDHSREKGHRRKWDEPENVGKSVDDGERSDAKSGKSLEPKPDSVSEIEKCEHLETKLNDFKDKGTKSREREERRVDSDSRSSRGRSEFVEEDNKREDVSSKERLEEHRKQRNADEDVNNTWVGDKSRRDVESHNSRTPEKIGRRESGNVDMDYERSNSFRRKESGKEGSWDDRSNGRDRENAKDSWKRNQNKETRDSEMNFDGVRDWELLRRGRGGDRIDGRPGGRKDGSRTEAVKTSSKYGISNENYDVIEIQTKPFNIQQPDPKPAPDSEVRSRSDQVPSEDTKDKFADDEDNDSQAEKSRAQNVAAPSRGTGSSLPPFGGPQELGTYNRNVSQGARGNNRMGRVGRGGRPSGRDNQQSNMPMPLVGSTFGPLGLPPPGPLQSLPPNMSPAPGPISPGVFIPSFQPPIVWSGGRGVDMNMLGVPPGLPPVPSGLLGPRFSPNLGNSPSGGLVFNPSGTGRGMPPSMSSPSFNTMPPVVRGQPQEKGSGGWVPPRNNVPLGKAPSRGEQNDYSQNFVDTGMRPQNFIRELELTSVVEDYPKLRELIQKKDEIVAKSATPPMYYKCDLREQVLSPEFFGTKFDVILVDPPWEEYVHRAPGVTDHMNYWTFEDIMNLKIEAIADTPSFIFLWVGDGVGLEQGRQCLKKWGFRRCEDICWVKTNKANATPGLRHDSHTLFQRSKEHCLMGIKGTVRRSTDGHIIHANIDTDVIIAEEPPYGSTAKPEDMYRIVEHFALGRRRLELFGEDHNIRSGWLTIGNGLSSSNFNSEAYIRNFADQDGKMWLGGGGRNPPPESPHLVVTTPDIESLRPKSPMKNQQQLQQQQSASISVTTTNSSNKRPANSPQTLNAPNLIIEGSSSNMPSPGPWMARDGGHLPPDGILDMYGGGYNGPFGPVGGEFLDYESHRVNML
ncbi:hypothetical protein CASFOL_006411 [Castilleja foliolosa]|uniref:Methyltransferase-like protein 1 n=1 Tax=Castilleja foliolosa TaxID=1961234 RepID=A0ABD3E6A9_9LAMI